MYAWLAAVALAAPPTAYPYRADVQLPEEGIVLIDVPLELRSPVDVRDGSDLLLVDATGNEIPFAVVDGKPQRTDVAGTRGKPESNRPIVWEPDPGSYGDRYDVWVSGRPVDGLSVGLRDVPAYADITVSRVSDDGDLEEVARRRVFRILRRDDTDIAGPFPPGHYKLDIQHVRAPTHIDGYRLSQPALPEATVELAVGAPIAQENGVTVYDVPLPRPLAGTHLTLMPEEDLFERDVRVHVDVTRDERPGTLAPALDAVPRDKVIGRVMIGDTSLSDTTLTLPTSAQARQYHVAIQGDPLTIPSAMLTADGLAIVVRNPGPGPHRLYGGAVHGQPSRDMRNGLDAMVRNLDRRVGAGEVEDNPQFEAPPIPGSALGPSIDKKGFTWRRPIDGSDEGPARIPLDEHVLSNARADLYDLRIATEDGRQVPYALRRHPDAGVAEDLPFTRKEKGKESVIEVEMPRGDLPLRHLTLTTEGGFLFNRTVTVWRQRGKNRDVIRMLNWNSNMSPTTLSIGVNARVGDELAITIDNGDDPPLSVERIDVQWNRWEVVAYLPDEPVELLYGDENRYGPSYDAAPSLRASRELPDVTLGDPKRLSVLADPVEKAAAIGGLGCVGVGFIGMLVLLVTVAPKGEDDEEEAEEADDAPMADADLPTAEEEPPQTTESDPPAEA